MLDGLVPSLELDLERFREVLPEIMRRTRLQRAAVAHQRLDRIGARCARELFAFALLPVDHGHRELGLRKLLVEREDLQRLLLRLGLGLMRRMPFLPQELRRAQERTRHLLPPDDVGPLVDQDGEIAPRLDPFRVERADDDLGRRTHDQRFGQLLVAAASHPRDLRSEPLDVFLLLHQQTRGDEEREVRIDMARRLEAAVEPLLDQLPDRVAVRPDGHAALDLGVVGELGPPHDIEIPTGKVLGLRSDLGHHRLFLPALAVFHVRICRSVHLSCSSVHQSIGPSVIIANSSARRSTILRFQFISSRSG